MFLHVAHTQVMRQGTAWCGEAVVGPHILGLENFLYHSGDPKAGAPCERCVSAILDRIGDAIRRIQKEQKTAETSEGGA